MPLASSMLFSLGHGISARPDVIVAVSALLVTIVLWLIDHRRKRRRISYRVHMNTQIGAMPDIRGTGDFVVRSNNKEVPDPSLVLIRVSNSGRIDIVKDDFEAEIQFNFGSRQVESVEVFEAKPAALNRILQPDPNTNPNQVGLTSGGSRISLPKFALNRGDRFKLLVLLSGKGNTVEGDAQLESGNFVEDTSGNGPSRRTIIFGGVTLLLLGSLSGLLAFRPAQNSNTGVQCVAGSINIVGSTAFEPAIAAVASAYGQACPSATISVSGVGSVAGVNNLNGQSDASKRSAEAVMYDGAVTPNSYPQLVGNPLAVVIFAVVVNQRTGVHNLSVDQLRGIFVSGKYKNWSQLGGNNLPIDIVARDTESGTRTTFQSAVLGGVDEHGRTSENCTTPDRGQASPVMLCEMNSTAELLRNVNAIPGAIGYSELSASTAYPNVERIQINGHDSNIQQDRQLAYPFWATEHIYTYNIPPSGSLLSAFLGYLNSDKAQNAIQKNGDIPCAGLTHARQHELCGI